MSAPANVPKWYPFAALTPDYTAGRGPAGECGHTLMDCGGPVALRRPSGAWLGVVCRECAAAIPGRWQVPAGSPDYLPHRMAELAPTREVAE